MKSLKNWKKVKNTSSGPLGLMCQLKNCLYVKTDFKFGFLTPKLVLAMMP
jgi:hypothetical protein